MLGPDDPEHVDRSLIGPVVLGDELPHGADPEVIPGLDWFQCPVRRVGQDLLAQAWLDHSAHGRAPLGDSPGMAYSTPTYIGSVVE